MTAQEQIAKLESLLERIRRNAEKPRPVRAEPIRAAASPVRAEPPPPKPAAAVERTIPPQSAIYDEPTLVGEEVSLDSLGATEASPAAPAAEAPRERVQSADMDDLEIVEIGSEVTELGAAEEPVPESAPRPAVQSVEVELEPPIKTPPPESGRQAVTPPPPVADARPAASDDDFDEDDLAEPDLSGAPISLAAPSSPTMAQLGNTVPLESAPPAELELAAPSKTPAAARVVELDVEPPKGRPAAAAAMEHHQQVPSEPREAPSRRVDPLAATVPDMRTALSLAQTAPDAGSPFADAIRATTEAKADASAQPQVASKPVAAPAPTAPELVVERPVSATTHAAEVVVAKPRKMPETFLELLDESLGLGA